MRLFRLDVKPDVVAKLGGRLLRSRRLMRAPIWIYRTRLGFLFGSRILKLQHVGRKTAARRYVVLEVIDHPTPQTYVVASGFGKRSDWFRNLEVNGHARVYTGVRAAVPDHCSHTHVVRGGRDVAFLHRTS
jgi:deazaflavin-dependent oxidoreductase (nitroreductase family)